MRSAFIFELNITWDRSLINICPSQMCVNGVIKARLPVAFRAGIQATIVIVLIDHQEEIVVKDSCLLEGSPRADGA